MAKFRVDFWQVLDQQNKRVDLEPIFAALAKQTNRVIERGADHRDWLAEIHKVHDQHACMVARVDKNDPDVADISAGTVARMKIGKNKGIACVVHLLHFDGVIAAERKGQFRASSWSDLIANLGKTEIYLEPILRKDAWERFGAMDRIGSIDVKLRSENFGTSPTDSIEGTLEHFAEEFHAVGIDLHLSARRGKNSDGLQRGIVRRVFGSSEEIVGKFRLRQLAK